MSDDLGDDLLWGARAIAAYMFKAGTKRLRKKKGNERVRPATHGKNNEEKQHVRRVYHLYEKRQRREREGRACDGPPIWKQDAELISRKSLLDAYYSGPIAPAKLEAAEEEPRSARTRFNDLQSGASRSER
jgi:hypothetical protein